MGKVIGIHEARTKDLRLKVNRLFSVRHTMHAIVRYEVEDMVYRLKVGSPIDFASKQYILDLYRTTFG